MTGIAQFILSIHLSVQISNASMHCYDVLQMVDVTTPYSSVDKAQHMINIILGV